MIKGTSIGEMGISVYCDDDEVVVAQLMVSIDRDLVPNLTDERYIKHLEEAARRAGEYLADRLLWYRQSRQPDVSQDRAGEDGKYEVDPR